MSDRSRSSRIRYNTFSILLVIGLTVAIASLWSSRPLLSASSSPRFWPYSASFLNPSLGLRLDMSVNSTSLLTGQAIQIRISEHNQRSTANSVKAANDWKVPGLGVGPCSLNLPIGFAIFKGYHGQNDFTQSEMLDLYPIGVYFCPAEFIISAYNFEALSDNVTFAGLSYLGSVRMNAVRTFGGTWTGSNFAGEHAELLPFSPGSYTVVGGDEWGDLLTLYFTVS